MQKYERYNADFYSGNAFIQLPSHLWDGENDLDILGFSQTF